MVMEGVAGGQQEGCGAEHTIHMSATVSKRMCQHWYVGGAKTHRVGPLTYCTSIVFLRGKILS